MATTNKRQIMIDMLQNAKDLIAKGQKLGDNDLIQMGMELLEQYSPQPFEPQGTPPPPEPEPTPDPYYICGACGHKMPIDREGRKRCPECKKHKLAAVYPVHPDVPAEDQPTYDELLGMLEDQQLSPAPRNDLEQFNMQVRGNRGKDGRVHYDENGNPDGVIRKREQINLEGLTNVWEDDGEEAHDQANETLKKFTKVSPRRRQPAKMMEVECDTCHRTEKVHPIHAGGRGRHLCGKCIQRRSQR